MDDLLETRELAVFARAKLRYAVACRVRSDRADPELVADEFGITVDDVSTLVAESSQDVISGPIPMADLRPAKAKKQAAVDAAGRWLAIQRMFESAGRTVPKAVEDAYRP